MKNLISHIKDKESVQLITGITEDLNKKLGRPVRIGVLGERNSGKSTLINHLCGETVCNVKRFDPTEFSQSVFVSFGKMSIELIDTYYSLCDLENLEKETNVELISNFDLILFLSKADQKHIGWEQNIHWKKFTRLYRQDKIIALLSKADQISPFKNGLPTEPDLFLDMSYFDRFTFTEWIIPICCNPDYNFEQLLSIICIKLNLVEKGIEENHSYSQLSIKICLDSMKKHSAYNKKVAEELIRRCDEILNKA